MIDLTEISSATALPEPAESSNSMQPQPVSEPKRRQRSAWGALAWSISGVSGAVAIAWFIFLGPGEGGTKAEWFFGAAVLIAAMVSMWQTHRIQRQANRDVAEAAARLRNELAAAEARSAQQLQWLQSVHRAETAAQQERTRAELDAQRELARAERSHLLAQQQRLAMVGVSRAINASTHALSMLWNQGASILGIEDREERENAMNPVFEQIGQVVNDFSVELANAHLLVQDESLHRALGRINEAALMAMRVAEDVHLAAVEGRVLQPNPVPVAQRHMRDRAAEARHLAWELLRSSLDETATAIS